MQRLGLELAVGFVQIDLAGAEGQRVASLREDGVCHPEHADVERDRRVEIGDSQNEMVEPIDAHELTLPTSSDSCDQVGWVSQIRVQPHLVQQLADIEIAGRAVGLPTVVAQEHPHRVV